MLVSADTAPEGVDGVFVEAGGDDTGVTAELRIGAVCPRSLMDFRSTPVSVNE